MITVNGWKFDFKTMTAYRDKSTSKDKSRITRDIPWDPMYGFDIIKISINYGTVFKYLPKCERPESCFFDPRYYETNYDSQIIKAYTDWLFEQQVLLAENTDRKI